MLSCRAVIWYHSQVVRHEPAKLRFPGSNPGGTSNKPEWRNGRRDGLKIRLWKHSVGSSPTAGTTRRYRDYTRRKKTVRNAYRFYFLPISIHITDKLNYPLSQPAFGQVISAIVLPLSLKVYLTTAAGLS